MLTARQLDSRQVVRSCHRLKHAHSQFAREYEGAYRNRCQPPTPSYFAGVLLEWASQNTPQQYYYFGHGKQSSLVCVIPLSRHIGSALTDSSLVSQAVQKVFLSRSFAGGATGVSAVPPKSQRKVS